MFYVLVLVESFIYILLLGFVVTGSGFLVKLNMELIKHLLILVCITNVKAILYKTNHTQTGAVSLTKNYQVIQLKKKYFNLHIYTNYLWCISVNES